MIGTRRPIPGECLVEAATFSVNRPRVPFAGQFLAYEPVDLSPECRLIIIAGNRPPGRAKAREERNQRERNDPAWSDPEHADDLPVGRGMREARRVLEPNPRAFANDVTGFARAAQAGRGRRLPGGPTSESAASACRSSRPRSVVRKVRPTWRLQVRSRVPSRTFAGHLAKIVCRKTPAPADLRAIMWN